MNLRKYPHPLKALTMVGLCALLGAQIVTATPEASFRPERWELSWSDEFDYSGPPNPEVWGYEYGYLGFNQELQNYTDKPENARVENGILIIEAHLKYVSSRRSREIIQELRGSNADVSLLGNQEFTSARLITWGKKEFSHARVEVCARFTNGRGTWPAIWLLGDTSKTPWPLCGEVDIMEHVGYLPNLVYSSVHSRRSNHLYNTGVSRSLVVDDVWAEFHVYSVEWDEGQIRFCVDDFCYHVVERGFRPER